MIHEINDYLTMLMEFVLIMRNVSKYANEISYLLCIFFNVTKSLKYKHVWRQFNNVLWLMEEKHVLQLSNNEIKKLRRVICH